MFESNTLVNPCRLIYDEINRCFLALFQTIGVSGQMKKISVCHGFNVVFIRNINYLAFGVPNFTVSNVKNVYCPNFFWHVFRKVVGAALAISNGEIIVRCQNIVFCLQIFMTKNLDVEFAKLNHNLVICRSLLRLECIFQQT